MNFKRVTIVFTFDNTVSQKNNVRNNQIPNFIMNNKKSFFSSMFNIPFESNGSSSIKETKLNIKRDFEIRNLCTVKDKS